MDACLIDARTLEQALAADKTIVVVDCRFDLSNPEAGRDAYRAGHLPGAVYAHLDADLSGIIGPQTGRHPLPVPSVFAARCSLWGIATGVRVVAYDDVGGAYAARLWWLLRWLGHTDVVVLNGGVQAWLGAGYPLETSLPQPDLKHFDAEAMPGMTMDASMLQSALAVQTCRLIDVRSSARFHGEIEPVDPVAGHIPGAINHPFSRLLDDDGYFLPSEVIRAQLMALLGTAGSGDVVAMCGSGVTACHLLLAMSHVGLPGGRLYPGSWSEWIRDPSRPVTTL